MHRGWFRSYVLALVLVPALASAATLPDELLHSPVYPTLEEAVHAFVASGHEPVLIRRLLSSSETGLYRLEGESTGHRLHALIDKRAGSGAGGLANSTAAAAYNVVGGSTRCVAYFYKDNNYGNLILTTDLDWNDLNKATGLNDVISSLQTTCGGLWLAQDANFNNGWPGYIYYVPAYTSLATLPSMNDSISSLKHDLP